MPSKDDFLVDCFVAMNRVHNPFDFVAVHLPKPFRTDVIIKKVGSSPTFSADSGIGTRQTLPAVKLKNHVLSTHTQQGWVFSHTVHDHFPCGASVFVRNAPQSVT